ncbi:hypothetical protein ES703_37610 [subsurface metagenome]
MKLLNMKETAEILSISERTLYQWHWQGKDFPFIKLGGVLRIDEEDLLDFVKKKKIKPKEA